MQTIHGFDYFPLHFNSDGNLEQTQEFGDLRQHAQSAGATDAIFVAHGFRNDENEATRLYTNLMGTLRTNMSRPEFQSSLGSRRFVVGGVLWPSKAFSEGDDDGAVQGIGDDNVELEMAKQQLLDIRAEASPSQQAKIDQAMAMLPTLDAGREAQDKFVSLVLSVLDGIELDPTEGLEQIKAKPGSELLDALRTPVILPVSGGDSEGGTAGIGDISVIGGGGGTALGFGSVVKSVFGRVGQFLNLTTWYLMKSRSGTVGVNGTAKAVRDLKAALPGIKIHLVGHSLGGRLMAACAKSLGQSPKLQPDSVTLLQAAFSHFGFSPDNGDGKSGFFRGVIGGQVVRGPLVATYSMQDTVVGKAYAISSRLAGDNTEAIGDQNDPFGGIGRNGAQKTTESAKDVLHAAGTAYTFKTGVVNNLDGSGGLITNHGDVTNENVTYALASALAHT